MNAILPSRAAHERRWPLLPRRPSLWQLTSVTVALVLALPVLVIFGHVFLPSTDVWVHLRETMLGEYVTNSLLLLFGVGVGVLVIGIPVAWLVSVCEFPGRRIFQWALMLPLAMPAYIIAYTYTGMLDFTGPVQVLIRDLTGLGYGQYWFPEIRSLTGAMLMLTLVLYPYVYLLTRAAFLEQSVCVLEVSRTLGSGPYAGFFRVALPLARPAVIAGLTLALMEVLADYGTVAYFGIPTFTTGIFRTWYGLADPGAAAQLAAVLLSFVFVLILLERWSRMRARFHHTSSRYSTLPRYQLRGWKAAAAVTACLLPILLGFLIPAAQLSLWAARTTDHWMNPAFAELVFNTFSLAAMAAVIAVALALILAYARRMQGGFITGLAVRVAGMGYAVPGTVIAIGVMLPFAWFDNTLDAFMREQFGVSTGLLLSGTLVALLFAYAVRFLAVSLQTVEAGLGKIKPSMDDAARSLGMRPLATLTRVHLPIMRGTLLTALLLVFVDVLKELPATLILRPFDFNTLAVRAFELAGDERLAESSSAALAIVLVGLLPVILLSLTIERSRPGQRQRARQRTGSPGSEPLAVPAGAQAA
ncbi:Ferric iron ABC transporter, permease protein [Thioalkalivibrio nitratireducens DSM 14787]|uniref:Ferric iron ABC transporter, permease protein n=1 Tax=Thioalkalivibrio nitratireducens (strain DSM 14787 / UNIQEM 213 / ALEN2) TaxID=1255043 RepID=L0DT83_THIND|nr:iron ABC transporter permease [Thioalkalivibrio nitratireducens]AGA32202.1 Ferric iron ABC transporter, permease protein [Thioalkalivibrio nitratireducens DSM 14787]